MFLLPSEEEGMKAALARKGVEVQRIKAKMSKVQSTENQLQNLCFQDPEIKYLGQGVRVVLALDTPTQGQGGLQPRRAAGGAVCRVVGATWGAENQVPEQGGGEAEEAQVPRGRGGTGWGPQGDRRRASRLGGGGQRGRGNVHDSSDEEGGGEPDEKEDEGEDEPAKKSGAVRTKYDRMFERKNQNVLSAHYSKLIEGDGDDDDEEEFITLKRADHELDGGEGGIRGVEEEGRRFAEGEKGEMQEANVRDKEEAKEKKREKKRKRKEREKKAEAGVMGGGPMVADASDDGYVEPEFDLPTSDSDDDREVKTTHTDAGPRAAEDDEELALRPGPLTIQLLSDVWNVRVFSFQHNTFPPTSQLPPPPALLLSSLAMLSRMRRHISSARITSDALAATRLTLNAIRASTDAFPPLKSSVSVVLVIMELKSQVNKKGCEHIAKRSAQLVQDIWRQTKDFGVVLPEEVERSVVDIEKYPIKEIESFFGGLETEKAWKRFARQDVHKSQVAEYGRLLDEAMMQFSFNLELSIPRLHMESAAADEKRHAAVHRLHMESAAADEKRHAAVLTVSQMSESERLLLTQIGCLYGEICAGVFFFSTINAVHRIMTTCMYLGLCE
ncbi:hypothetical protein B0H14DRAFT_3899306 [Mycena olivaceomarginata]|nr:hypothetical protein B0H14DRAFT_3899306 [Mycena olivaceomarginata]